MVLITGNTFPVKDQIKALGGRWDATAKGWRVPEDKAAQARKLVIDAPTSERKSFRRPSNPQNFHGNQNCCDCFDCHEEGCCEPGMRCCTHQRMED